MFNMALDFVSYTNQLGLTSGIIVLTILGLSSFLIIIGQYPHIKREYPKKYKLIITSVLLCSILGIMYTILLSITESPKNYKVGMCFNKHEEREHKEVQGKIRHQLNKKTQALLIATKIQAKNQAKLEEEVNVLSLSLEESLKISTLGRPIIILSQNNGNLYYDQVKNEIKTDFTINSGYFLIECSPELKKVALNYEKTGTIAKFVSKIIQ